MYPVTDTFLDVVRAGGYVRTTTASVFFAGQYVTDVPIVSGSVDFDRTADIRRSCQIVIGDESFVPTFVNSPLAPYGAELVVNSGITYDNGTTEMCQLGVFRIEEVTWDEASGSLPNVKAYDRSKALQDALLLYPIDRSGVGAQYMITDCVLKVMTVPVTFDLSLTDYTLPGGSIQDSDRWGWIKTMAQGMGAEAYFDVHGNFVVVPVPGLTQADISTSTPVWEIDAGSNGVLVNASRGVTRTGVANAIGVMGAATGSGASPMGFAADTDPRSPTYWGPATSLPYSSSYAITNFGPVVKRINNNTLTTVKQCTIAAQAELRNSVGLARSLSFESVWNPALQEGDVIRITYLEGTSELHILDKVHIPLAGTDKMSCTTRTLTYQSTANT